ncbi:MAG: tRNA dihydrouridine(20/20a) synthase DusA [Deltaproteobacteria bacterium]|jgi:tRNA-dihydrouridine synthase A|nr:tRNA dihydrouridine(20/20a) synthase DusA [Deltaproteobacteria bacterium]
MRRGPLHPISVAPMMDHTDRNFRVMMRMISRRTLLYTEMITTYAILHGKRDQLLGFDALERPLSLQLGGDDPVALQACAKIAEDLGYDEINLNCGCPSDRVQSGRFGACLMAHPERVAEGVAAMRAAVSLPVTVKHRIGIDDQDRYEDLRHFVDVVAQAGADRFTVHARKAWLSGLSPKENRTIPPLRYEDVYRLKAERPDLAIEINGGITTLDQATQALEHTDGVMIGRGVCDHPLLFADVDRRFYGEPEQSISPAQVLEALIPYVEAHLARGGRLTGFARHALPLMNGRPGARAYKRWLSTEAPKAGADLSVWRAAVTQLKAA